MKAGTAEIPTPGAGTVVRVAADVTVIAPVHKALTVGTGALVEMMTVGASAATIGATATDVAEATGIGIVTATDVVTTDGMIAGVIVIVGMIAVADTVMETEVALTVGMIAVLGVTVGVMSEMIAAVTRVVSVGMTGAEVAVMIVVARVPTLSGQGRIA